MIAGAKAHEAERRRDEALTEIDRAKTAFLSDMSHKNRTPLTLALGPLDDMLARGFNTVVARREELEQIHRNMQRLLKLVNTLLDFLRIDAGRAVAYRAPVDLARHTAGLAAVFRSAVERGGLRLIVDCQPLHEPVYVDPGMWEKIVLNLLSNAFKFTFEGEIAVSLSRDDGMVQLAVRDTGTGIAAHELPRLFDRFHRIEGARGRTSEGSGLGLALVQDLVRLHGGTVQVQSTEGRGSCFTVTMPMGQASGSADRAAGPNEPPTAGPERLAHVEEALGWLPDAAEPGTGPDGDLAGEALPVGLRRPHVLLAVDNVDTQRCVGRLLGAYYEVEAVGGGEAALAAARRRVPDLVLSDIVMPRMDGLALLRALRDDPCTRGVPVVLLSARAGEERKVEVTEAGADDCIAKPFSAQELLARVAARLEVARLQRDSIERERVLRDSSDEADAMRRLHELSTRLLAINGVQPVLEEVLDATIALHGADFGMVQLVDPPTGDLLMVAQRGLPAEFVDYFARVHDEASACGRAMSSGQRVVIEDVTTDGGLAPHRHIAASTGFRAVQSTPLVSHNGELFGMVSTHFRRPHHFTDSVLRFTDLYVRHAADFIERQRVEAALRASEGRFRRYFDLGLIGMALTSPSKGCLEVNDELCRILGYSRGELLGKSWPEMTHPDDLPADVAQFDRVMAGEMDGYSLDKRWLRKDGRVIHSTMTTKCLRAPDGSVDCFVGLVLDITDRLESDDALRRARDELAHVARVTAMGELVASIAHEMNQPLSAVVANGHAARRWLATRPPNLPEAVAAIDRIVGDAHRASQVIAGIRGFLRRDEVRRAVVDMHEVLRGVAAIIESDARAGSVKVRIAPPEQLLRPVIGDRVQLQQVVLNLAMNGIEAMAGVPEARRCLQMGVERDGPRMLRVSVRDAGIGLDPADRDRIFDAFYSSKPAGMGMGLAISRSLVEAHGGRLWCARNEDGGETFSFTVPT